MKIEETEKFYKKDKKKYIITKNKELLTWLKQSIKNGYNPVCDIEDLQGLIETIAYWFELKYPERELEFYEGVRYFDFEYISTLSKAMHIKQLMYRLPHEQLCLLECNYRAGGGGIADIYNNKGEIVGHKPVLFMRIDRKNISDDSFLTRKEPYFLLHADTNTGKVIPDYNTKEYTTNSDITLDELLALLKENYSDRLKFTNLEECIYNHKCDIELRRQILQLVALKLLYSDKTIPERGYERAKRFINEFNKKLGLNLTTTEIDESISKENVKDIKREKQLKK